MDNIYGPRYVFRTGMANYDDGSKPADAKLARDVLPGDKFYDREFGLVIVTLIHSTSAGQLLFDVDYVDYNAPSNRRKAGSIYFASDDILEVK